MWNKAHGILELNTSISQKGMQALRLQKHWCHLQVAGPSSRPPLVTWTTGGDGGRPTDLNGLLWESNETWAVQTFWNILRGMKIKAVTFPFLMRENETKNCVSSFLLITVFKKDVMKIHQWALGQWFSNLAEHLNPQGSQVIKTEVYISSLTYWIRISMNLRN